MDYDDRITDMCGVLQAQSSECLSKSTVAGRERVAAHAAQLVKGFAQ